MTKFRNAELLMVTESNELNQFSRTMGIAEQGLRHLFITASSCHFFDKTDFEQYLLFNSLNHYKDLRSTTLSRSSMLFCKILILQVLRPTSNKIQLLHPPLKVISLKKTQSSCLSIKTCVISHLKPVFG